MLYEVRYVSYSKAVIILWADKGCRSSLGWSQIALALRVLLVPVPFKPVALFFLNNTSLVKCQNKDFDTFIFQAGTAWAFLCSAYSGRAKPKQSPSAVTVALHGLNPLPLLASLETPDLEFGWWQQRASSGGLCVWVLHKQTMEQQLQQIVSGANLLQCRLAFWQCWVRRSRADWNGCGSCWFCSGVCVWFNIKCF